MFIGVYLCLSGLVLLVGLAVLARARERFGSYSLLAFVVSFVALVVFIGLSAVTDLMPVGGAGSYSYPQDYFEYGPIGWAIMVIPLLGLVSPLLVGWWLGRSSGLIDSVERHRRWQNSLDADTYLERVFGPKKDVDKD